MKRLLSLSFLLMSCIHFYAQETVYLTSQSETTEEKDKASEKAVITTNEKGKGYTVDFFSMEGILLRTSQYSKFGKTPDKQILHGKTIYKFANSEKDSLVCHYKDNLRVGAATFYYPDGKRHVECIYKGGLLDGILLQYYANDSIKRKDIYKRGVAIGTNIYSEQGELLGNSPFYVAPAPLDEDLNTIYKEVAQAIELPIWKNAGKWEAHVEITFDAKGNMMNVRVLQSNHPKLAKASIQAVNKVLQNKTFAPATMDKQPVCGSIILPLICRIERVL